MIYLLVYVVSMTTEKHTFENSTIFISRQLISPGNPKERRGWVVANFSLRGRAGSRKLQLAGRGKENINTGQSQ
jgi:hypothetical protein